jgi:hypothetical protein
VNHDVEKVKGGEAQVGNKKRVKIKFTASYGGPDGDLRYSSL